MKAARLLGVIWLMAKWQRILSTVATNTEEYFDMLKYRLGERLGGDNPIKIIAYRGYGTRQKLYLKGRVLEDKGITPASDNDSLWDNLVNMYRRFATDEVPGARLLARFQGQEQEVTANEEGFFEVWFEPVQPLPADTLWHTIELELRWPIREGYGPVRTTGEVLVPLPDAQFGVISDIDDTVVYTHNANLLLMARTVFLGNARTRLPFEGVAAFYRALHAGASGQAQNPMLYVSSSAWNIYDLLSDFFQLQNIPIGPVLFLRDWGISRQEIMHPGHRRHKLATIRQMLDLYHDLPFILIGDSGQEDPEIYYELVTLYPKRIPAIFIRNVSRSLERPNAIRALAKKVLAAGSTLILADNTIPLAEYSIQQGWIRPEALPVVQVERAADAAPPSPLEQMLGEEEKVPGPTVVIDGQSAPTPAAAVADGAIEEALDQGDAKTEKPPTVIVKGEEEG